MKIMKTTSLKFFKPTLATTLGIGSWRLVLLLATAVSLIGYPKPASAASVNVEVGAPGPPPPAVFRVQLRAFVGNDPSWRSGDVDLGFERAQHNVIFPGVCGHRQNMEFWSA